MPAMSVFDFERPLPARLIFHRWQQWGGFVDSNFKVIKLGLDMKVKIFKTTVKKVTTLLLLSVLTLNLSCNTDDQDDSPCNTPGGPEISNQTARVYRWTNSEPEFYYLGNEQPVPTGINGGYIPCNDLPTEFKKEGLIVKYSGIDKGSYPDTGDPLWAYVDLKSIEKVN